MMLACTGITLFVTIAALWAGEVLQAQQAPRVWTKPATTPRNRRAR